MYRGHGLLLAIVLVCSAVAAEAQTGRRGLVRLELGTAEIHHEQGGSSGFQAAMRVARAWRDDRIRLEGGIISGTSDGGFTGADVGTELRLCSSTCRAVPYVAVALGGITDRFGATPMARLSAGFDVKLSTDRLLRFSVLRSTHGKGFAGPNGFAVGVTQRFGTRRGTL
jgi:hypothetical protein